MTDIFLVLLSATLQAVSYTLCFVLTFRQNKTGKKLTFIIALLFINATNWISSFIPYHSLKPVLMYVLQFLLICILYRDPMREKLFLFCIVHAVSVPLEALAFVCFQPGFIPLSPTAAENIFGKQIAGITLAAFQIPWVLMFRKLRKEWEDFILWKFYIFVLGQFLLEIMALQTVYMNHMTTKNGIRGLSIQKDTVWQYRIGIILFILVTLLIYFVLFSYMKRKQMNIQLQMKNEEMAENMQYYRHIEEKAAQIRRIRHDAENHLAMAERLIEENPEKAEIYLNEMKKSIEKL